MTYPQVKLFNWQLTVPNLKEYHTLKREIFSQHQYFIELDSASPYILDVGSHIGLSVFYFKRLFPGAKIIALEPHPEAFTLLKQNLHENRLTSVLPLNQALWSHSGQITLYSDPSPESWWSNTSASPGTRTRSTHTRVLASQAVTLPQILSGLAADLDLVKLDVEGAETDILFHTYSHFTHVKHYLIEFHPHPGLSLLDFCSRFPKSHQVTCFKHGKPLNPKSRRGGLVIVKVDRV